MDLGGLVYKRVWKITFFGLNRVRIWRNWRNTPTKNSQGNPPPPGALSTRLVCILETSLSVSLPISICSYFYTHAVINYLVAM